MVTDKYIDKILHPQNCCLTISLSQICSSSATHLCQNAYDEGKAFLSLLSDEKNYFLAIMIVACGYFMTIFWVVQV